MLYLTKEELCEFYQVGVDELTDTLKEEKQLGTLFYHEEPFDELRQNDYLAVVLPVMGEIVPKSYERLPLLPFPIPKITYESAKLDEEYLVFTLARYKIAHLRGDFSQSIILNTDEFQRSVATILQDYDYLNPFMGRVLYWIDLKPELSNLIYNLPLEEVDDIVAHGRRIRVLRKTLGK